jgi:antitoxin HicB
LRPRDLSGAQLAKALARVGYSTTRQTGSHLHSEKPMLQFTYPVKLTADRKDGGFVVTCRDLPEAITQGDSVEEALSEAEGALQAAIEGRVEDTMDIPAPSQPRRGERLVATPITTALKAAVSMAMRDDGISKAELARRMHVNEKEARRMLDPGHPTKVPTFERALAALGRRAAIAVT